MTARVVAMAVLYIVSLASCSATQRPGAPFPVVDAYEIQDLLPPHQTTIATGELPATPPDLESDRDPFQTGPSGLGATREALRALVTHGGKVESIDILALISREFERYDPTYLAHQASQGQRLDALKRRLTASEKTGRALPCSRRMMIEAEWLLDYTARWHVLDQKLMALEQSLAVADQGFALKQAPDGSWGRCYDAWFEKLGGTIDVVGSMPAAADGRVPALRYRFDFLRPIDKSAILVPYLYRLQLSSIATTGIYEREELGATEGALSQFLFKDSLRALLRANGAAFVDRAYVDAYRHFLDETQDPISGYWGSWIVSNGEIVRTADLSQTFHAVSYREGDVRDWPQIVRTTLAIKDFPYPYGWMHNGNFNNHNNYDVVKILRLGWPRMTPGERDTARVDIRTMVQWALEESITADGRFRDDPSFYDSVAEAYYYGISFLDEVGYWSEARNFWEEKATGNAGAAVLCRKVRSHLDGMRTNSMAAREALETLDRICPLENTQ